MFDTQTEITPQGFKEVLPRGEFLFGHRVQAESALIGCEQHFLTLHGPARPDLDARQMNMGADHVEKDIIRDLQRGVFAQTTKRGLHAHITLARRACVEGLAERAGGVDLAQFKPVLQMIAQCGNKVGTARCLRQKGNVARRHGEDNFHVASVPKPV